jgi:hypothetical protein
MALGRGKPRRETDVTECHDTDVREDARQTDVHQPRDEQDAAIAWLRSEFPEWEFEVGATRTTSRTDVPRWVARREGHHPQAELSPGKLYSRLSDYLDRERSRRAHDVN